MNQANALVRFVTEQAQIMALEQDLHVIRRRLDDTERIPTPTDLDLLRMAVAYTHQRLEQMIHHGRTLEAELLRMNSGKSGN